jgi:hypothetical protein
MTTMGLYFHNKTNATLWVVYADYEPDCEDEGGVKWEKNGWYKVIPGKTVKVWSGWAGGNKFFFYAEDDFGHVWAGGFFTHIPWVAFSWCWATSSSSGRTLGLRKFFASNMDYTINLVL